MKNVCSASLPFRRQQRNGHQSSGAVQSKAGFIASLCHCIIASLRYCIIASLNHCVRTPMSTYTAMNVCSAFKPTPPMYVYKYIGNTGYKVLYPVTEHHTWV
jgi:hypothetical protein